jgi:hypothetical protein
MRALLNFEWVTRRSLRCRRERMVLSCSPSVRRWRLWPGTLGPYKAWPSGHRLRRQGLDKGQRPGTRSTMRSTVRRGWTAHFHPLVFQERQYEAAVLTWSNAYRRCIFITGILTNIVSDYVSLFVIRKWLSSGRDVPIGTIIKGTLVVAVIIIGTQYAAFYITDVI